jgi:mono/diheme cytochrome c family protein
MHVKWIHSVLIIVALALPLAAQQPDRKITDGVFSSDQAARGKSAFEGSCARCHNVALVGSQRGPAIKGPTFLSHWEKDTLAGLFTKIRDTMPEGGPGTVSDELKIDILSYILQQNGFPAGPEELKVDLSALEDIRVKPDAEGAGPSNFSLVEVIGCLGQDQNKKWTVTSATTPVVTKEETSTPAALKAAEPQPLGSETFGLVSVTPSLHAESHRGHKVEVRGLLYRDASYAELNLTSLDTVRSSCAY